MPIEWIAILLPVVITIASGLVVMHLGYRGSIAKISEWIRLHEKYCEEENRRFDSKLDKIFDKLDKH